MRLLYVMVLVLAFLLGYSCGVEAHSGFWNQEPPPRFQTEVVKELDCLALRVVSPTQRFLLPMRRYTIRLEMYVRRHADHVLLVINADGGMAGADHSRVWLSGDAINPQTGDFVDPYQHTREFRDKPASDWAIVAAVFDRAGKLKARESAQLYLGVTPE